LAGDFQFVPEKYSRFVSKTLWPMPTLTIMFPASSIVKQVQNDDENNRFYAQAEVVLAEDLDHAELQLRDIDSSVYAAPLINAKAGVNTFYISGSGNSPFKIGGFSRWIKLSNRFLQAASKLFF
jgi:hypothetical protein